jgi:CDP-glucose 4,6-dehydratase
MQLVDRLENFVGASVFVTGHTGFKGSWLALWLSELGARVSGYALDPATEPNNFTLSGVRDRLCAHHVADLRDYDSLRRAIAAAAPSVIFHLAAQPLVRESYRTPRTTFETNVMGTVNLLEAVRESGIEAAVVVVTSDKCYENREWHWPYRENEPMGGSDPYSASKGAAELVVASYRRSYFPPDEVARHGVRLASARAGNVFGGGDWSSDRIVVDLVSALRDGRPVPIRNPQAVRPWQHVLESLSGYLTLASALLDSDGARYCDGWNFGPSAGDTLTVRELVEAFIDRWGAGAWIDAREPGAPHEAATLRLAIEKAQLALGWRPRWAVNEAVQRTIDWYKQAYSAPQNVPALSALQIRAYVSAA